MANTKQKPRPRPTPRKSVAKPQRFTRNRRMLETAEELYLFFASGHAASPEALYELKRALLSMVAFMLDQRPTGGDVAHTLYLSIMAAWRSMRARQDHTPEERETVRHHSALLEAMDEAYGLPPRGNLCRPEFRPAQTWSMDGAAELQRGTRTAETEQKLDELRKRLDKLTDITDETARLRIEREIYDLEHAVDEDEWPEMLTESEVR